MRDFNRIWGIISKTAVNQDGRSVTPITKPSMSQQEELLRRIYSKSDLATVQYIEAHGTGTPAGDPTEAGSISNAIAKARPSGSDMLRIGSVKSNIGHTESAAGVAGLIKVLLMMKHETIVPSVFYSEDSASVDAAALNIKIPTEPERWESTGSLVRVAGINSFGFGGTNTHAIVKDYRQTCIPKSIHNGSKKTFVISAASERSLLLTISDVYQRLSRDRSVDLNALLYTSACRRSHRKHKYRKVFLVSSLLDLEQQLEKSAEKQKVESTKPDTRVVFVFCGNGVSYRGLCRQLLEEEPKFREKVTEVEKLFQSFENISILQMIADNNEHDDFTKPDVVQPLLFAVQVGVAGLLKHWGIKADVVLGHSVGEVAAAHYSGLLTLEDAVKVVHHRCSLQSRVTGGKMLVVSNVAVAKVLEILPAFSGKVCIAAFNSPLSCTLSGNADAIDTIHQRLKTIVTDKKLFLHILEVPAAYHSHMMDSILNDIETGINCLAVGDMDCELYSTVTGNTCSNGDFTTGSYWAKNIREPVLFEQTLRALTNDTQKAKRNNIFVEIGARRALQRNILETLGDDTIVAASVQPQKDSESMLSMVSRLFELGLHVDWYQFYSGRETFPTEFPVYQFDTSKKVQFEARKKINESTIYPHHFLISKTPCEDNKQYTFDISSETLPYLWQHKINGIAIVPGALYVELAWASIMASLSQKKIPITKLHVGLSFNSLLALSSNLHPIKVTLEHGTNEGTFGMESSSAKHASGTYSCISSQPLLEEPTINPEVIRQRCKSVINREEIYSLLSQAGFEYGSVFRQLEEVCFGNQLKEAVMAVRVPGEVVTQLQQFFLHPVVLDYFLQMTVVVGSRGQSPRQGFPSGVGCVAISAPLQQEMIIYLRATQETPDFLEVCGCFANKDGKVLVELKDVRVSFLSDVTNVVETLFFQNKIISTTGELDLNRQKKALIFEDQLGIAKALSPYLHPESTFITNTEQWLSNQLRDLVLRSQNTDVDVQEVLFIWGAQNVSHLSPENVSSSLVGCCELFRQVVLALKESKRPCTVRVITYRSAEGIVDHISPGFVLSGMLRACAAEVTELSFQLVDLASLTGEDIQTLVHIINTCSHQEVRIWKGHALFTRIARTHINDSAFMSAVPPRDFVLMTADPYRILNLSAMPTQAPTHPVQERSVEVQLTKVCTHSSDYFPVSTSHLDFGKTMYWNKHTSQNHMLLALDYIGVVTATGSRVDKLKVGDRVACCYPVGATSKVVIPEAVCYDTETLGFLRETPCLSYFVLAWDVLKRLLPCGKHLRRLAIISSEPASGLVEVLVWTANREGWHIICRPQFTNELLNSDRCHAFVFLPPYNQSWCGINIGESLESHMIFVCNDQMSLALSNMFSWKSEDIHLHKVNVFHVLQRSNLKAQKRKIFDWLLTLDMKNMDLKSATFQLSGTQKSQTCVNVESYFTTDTLQQVVLDHGSPMSQDCPLSDIPFLMRPEPLFKNNCIYIVTGGLSGLGLETIKFIAHHGGGCIVTLSRRRISTKMQTEMENLQKRCRVTVMSIQCDVSISTQVVEAITTIVQSFPSWPIKGVFHSAAVLHDALIENLDQSLFQKVFRPKVTGVLNLHYATLHNKLDYFVCYSSISSFIGNASQCNYSAANSFLDTFCHYRRNLGLAGQSINWGPLNLGLLLNKDHFQRFLETKGMRIMDVLEVHKSLEKCLQINNPQQVVCKFNFSTLSRHVLSQNASLRERLSDLLEFEQIGDLSVEPWLQPLSSLRENLKIMLSKISNVSADELDDDVTLSSLGIDSMLAMTLQNQLFQDTGVTVPLVGILDPNSTLTTLVAILSDGT